MSFAARRLVCTSRSGLHARSALLRGSSAVRRTGSLVAKSVARTSALAARSKAAVSSARRFVASRSSASGVTSLVAARGPSRFFASSAGANDDMPAASKQTQSAAKSTSLALAQELAMEIKATDAMEQIAKLPEVPEGFILEDIPGTNGAQLVRQIGEEHITVRFRLITPEEVPSETEMIEYAKKHREYLGRGLDNDLGSGEEEEKLRDQITQARAARAMMETQFIVTVHKGADEGVEITVSEKQPQMDEDEDHERDMSGSDAEERFNDQVEVGGMEVVQVQYIPTSKALRRSPTAEYIRSSLYDPPFAVESQGILREYLEARGIDADMFHFISQYNAYKEEREYRSFARNLYSFFRK